jgi:hypothetical protein
MRLGSADWVGHLDGDELLLVWGRPHQQAVEARRLDASSSPVGPPPVGPLVRLNSRPIERLSQVTVSPAGDGGFVAFWAGSTPLPDAATVLRARRFSPTDEPLGPDFDVTTPGASCFAVVAAPQRGLAVSWVLDSTLYLRMLDAFAEPLGPDVPIATGDGLVCPSSMALDPAGNLLVLWTTNDDLKTQLFAADGQSLGPPIRLGSEPLQVVRPLEGDVAWGGDSWLVAWNAAVYPFDQGTGFLRRFVYRPPASTDPSLQR